MHTGNAVAPPRTLQTPLQAAQRASLSPAAKAAGMAQLAPPTHADDPTSAPEAPEGPAAALPVELLAEVLQRVPLRMRLTTCALVCSSWRGAAARVTKSEAMNGFALSQPQLSSLMAWLPQHGQHITSLSVCGRHSASERPSLGAAPLACPRLQSLDLMGCTVQLQVLQGCSGLTRLALGARLPLCRPDRTSNAYPGAPRSFTAVATLSALQHLACTGDAGEGAAVAAFPPGVLSSLVALTHLRLTNFNINGAALEGLSRVSGLQHMMLGTWEEDEHGQESESEVARVLQSALAAVSGLQRLTSLSVLSADGVLSPGTAPGFSSLSALECLALKFSAGIAPAVLGSHTQLRSLELSETPVSSAAELLAVLPRLQALSCLQLFGALDDEAPPGQYTALLASGKLESLLLTGCVLPEGCWQAMFSGVAPSLTRLVANTLDADLLDTDDLRSLATACPNLAGLFVAGSVEPGTDWSVLGQLQHLDELRVSDISDGTAANLVRGLSQLTGLTDLSIADPNSLTAVGMWQFVQLQQLGGLHVESADEGGWGADIACKWDLSHVDHDDDVERPVWQQLVLDLVQHLVNGRE